MTANASQSDLHLLRLDREGIEALPEEVRRAAQLLTAYIAGLDRGLREAAATGPGPDKPGEAPATDPDDLPGQGGAAARDELEKQAGQAFADDQATARAAGAGVESGICTPISGIPVGVPQSARTGSPDILIIWGDGCYQQISGQAR
jgi:hypothetical protein